MSLENLLDEIKQEAEQEIKLLEKEADLLIKEINQEKETLFNSLKQEKERKIAEKKEKRINNYLEEKKFQSEMEILRLKNQLIDQAAKQVKEKLKEMPEQAIKEIFQKEIEEINKINKENCFISVPVKKKSFFIDLFPNDLKEKITEKQLNFEQGFIIENNEFILKVDLEETIDKKIAEEKQLFFNLLFNQ